jgi:hypothetical protein
VQDLTSWRLSRQHEAREARAQIETGLDMAGWPWSRRLSLWIDTLVVIQESHPT